MTKYLWLCIAVLFYGCAGMQGQKTATIEIEGNPTTGYTWVYTVSQEGVVREVSNEYTADKTDKGLAGLGGKFIFTFKSIAAGETRLVFSYLRIWEKDVPAVKTLAYKASVDNKKNLKLMPE